MENFSDSSAWDSFIAQYAGYDGGLLQSWVWGEVQRAAGRTVRRIAVVDGHRIVAGWQVIAHPLPLGQSYWYVPRPVPPAQHVASIQYQDFFRHIISLAGKQPAVFIRVDEGESLPLDQFGFRRVPGSVQPIEELTVDVRPGADTLLSAMKPKTRYNIHLAQKHGVVVAEAPLDEQGLAAFWPLLRATAVRQKIRTHPERYYRAMFAVLAKAGSGRLLVAQHHDTPLAVALLAAHNGVLTYLHGGSADQSSELMAPHLLHWQAMALAQRLGCRSYNFGGVSSTEAAWAGLTRFKHGFAPNTKFTRYGGLWERPVRRGWYMIYRLAKFLRNATTQA